MKAGQKLAILGATYKADIDDARESPAGLLVEAAKKQGIETAVHDPLVKAGNHHGLIVSNDMPGVLKGAAAAALLVEHCAYRSLSAKFFGDHMTGRLIGDSRYWLNHASLRRSGFTVVVLGQSPEAQTRIAQT